MYISNSVIAEAVTILKLHLEAKEKRETYYYTSINRRIPY